MNRQRSHLSIDEALNLLRDEERSFRRKRPARNTFFEGMLAELFSQFSRNVFTKTARSIEEKKERVEDMTRQVKTDIRRHPWTIMAGMTASLYLVGYVAGFVRKRHQGRHR